MKLFSSFFLYMKSLVCELFLESDTCEKFCTAGFAGGIEVGMV